VPAGSLHNGPEGPPAALGTPATPKLPGGTSVRYVIFNGDDLGASPGINHGIVEAHRRGVLTSASLIVNLAASQQAARLTRELPTLSVGLHANLMDPSGQPLVDLETGERCRAILQQQLHSFQQLTGRPPTHLDSHHNLHRKPQLLPSFLELADRYRLPLRGHSPVRHFSKFYGQWGGKTHLEQISAQGLIRLLETGMADGFTELSCHPGCCDPELQSSYRIEREVELRSLCDPLVREWLSVQQIQLVNFREAMRLLAAASQEKGSTWSRS
jgi:chitin disaccharide deacetylase